MEPQRTSNKDEDMTGQLGQLKLGELSRVDKFLNRMNSEKKRASEERASDQIHDGTYAVHRHTHRYMHVHLSSSDHSTITKGYHNTFVPATIPMEIHVDGSGGGSSSSDEYTSGIGLDEKSSSSRPPPPQQQCNNVVEGRNDSPPTLAAAASSSTTGALVSAKTNDRSSKAVRGQRRFHRFVAAKQHQRARRLKRQQANDSVCPNTEEEIRAKYQDNKEDTALAALAVKNDIDIISQTQSMNEEFRDGYGSLPNAVERREEDQAACKEEVDSDSSDNDKSDEDVISPPSLKRFHMIGEPVDSPAFDAAQTQAGDLLASSPERVRMTDINPKDSPVSVESPTSVRETSTFVDDNSSTKKTPTCSFIQFESANIGNLKSIMQKKHLGRNGSKDAVSRTRRKKKKKKNLTWYDDEMNKDKPFTLKTDESLDWMDDDDSTSFNTSVFDDMTNDDNIFSKCHASKCNTTDAIKELLSEEYFKRVKWIDRENQDSPYEVPESDLFVPYDESVTVASSEVEIEDGSLCYDHILSNLITYYKRKVEDSISQVCETTLEEGSLALVDCHNPIIDTIDSTLTSFSEDERMTTLLKMDQICVISDEENTADESSEDTHQRCNTTSCL